MATIIGNTYPVRDQLRAMGGTWNPALKGWTVPEHRAAEARALVAVPDRPANVADARERIDSWRRRRWMSQRPAATTPVMARANGNVALSDEYLRQVAPSIFAVEPWHGMSDKYAFVPTSTIVMAMRENGFVPVAASQSRTRIPGKIDFTRHMIRFRKAGEQPLTHVGQIFPELSVVNSHDGASAYWLDAGLLKLACMNGMIVSDRVIERYRVPHKGAVAGILAATFRTIDLMPRMIDSVERLQRKQLAPPERNEFGRRALAIRYPENPPVTVEQVLGPRRTEDNGNTLWQTLNVVQEHLVQGGLRGFSESDRRLTTRPVTGISENLSLNKTLWDLAETFAAA